MTAGIQSLPELYAHALAIEIEAEDTYALLADQMDVHNNRELAALFRKLSVIEGKHAKEIEERAKDIVLPDIAPWEYQWQSPASPEAADVDDVHYLMTPHHALMMALAAEKRAQAFFEDLARSASDPEVKAMAEEFAAEEREHVRLVEDLLARHPAPAEGWDEDMDPPVLQE